MAWKIWYVKSSILGSRWIQLHSHMKWNGTESWPPERSSQIRRSRYSVLQKAKPGWSTKDLLKVLGQKAKGEPRRHIYIYIWKNQCVFLLTIIVIQLLRINDHLNEWTSIYRWCFLVLLIVVDWDSDAFTVSWKLKKIGLWDSPNEVQGITLVISGHCHSPGFVWWPPKNLVGSCIPVYFLRWLWVKTMVTSGDIPCRFSGWLPWKIPKSLSEISWWVKEIPSGYST